MVWKPWRRVISSLWGDFLTLCSLQAATFWCSEHFDARCRQRPAASIKMFDPDDKGLFHKDQWVLTPTSPYSGRDRKWKHWANESVKMKRAHFGNVRWQAWHRYLCVCRWSRCFSHQTSTQPENWTTNPCVTSSLAARSRTNEKGNVMFVFILHQIKVQTSNSESGVL